MSAPKWCVVYTNPNDVPRVLVDDKHVPILFGRDNAKAMAKLLARSSMAVAYPVCCKPSRP